MKQPVPVELKKVAKKALVNVVDRIPTAQLVELAKSNRMPQGQLLNLAKVLSKSGDEVSARRLMESNLALTSSKEAYTYTAYLQSKQKDYVAATATLAKALEIGELKDNPEINYQLARNAKLLGDYKTAKKFSARAVALESGNTRYWQGLLDANSQEPVWRRLEILEEGYSEGIKTDKWLTQLADYRMRMQRFPEAVELLTTLNSEKPTESTTLKLAEALFHTEGVASAEQCIQKNASVLGAGAKEKGLESVLLRKGAWKNVAQTRMHRLTAKSASNDYHAAGFALMRSYRFEDAKFYLRKAIADAESKPIWMYHLGFCEEKLANFEAALTAYLTAYLMSDAPYHLYRALYVERFVVGETRATEQLSIYLRNRYDQKFVSDVPERLADPEIIRYAKLNRYRDVVRAEAKRLIATSELGAAGEHLEWLVNTASMLEPEDYRLLAYISVLEGELDVAREYYLGTRDFRSAHGLDTSKYGQRRDYIPMVYTEASQELPVDETKVLYESNHGGKITCNIYPLLRQNLSTERGKSQMHVVVLNSGGSLPDEFKGYDNVVTVERDKYSYALHLATAGWLINNNTFAPYFIRRPEQKYLNTWHGTPLKTLGKDIRSGLMDHKNAARNFLQATHMLFPNAHTRHVLLNRYDVEGIFAGKAAITGYPRIDLTLDPDKWCNDSSKFDFGSGGKPTVLYAPTWRGTLAEKKFDTRKLMQDLARLSELDATILFRPHPLMEDQIRDLDLPVRIVPESIDTNFLLGFTDVLVTDYSSVFFDFYSTGRPVLLYAYDQDEYFAERGAYFNMADLPGILVQNIDSLILEIQRILEAEEFTVREGELARSDFSPLDDGMATHRALEFFFNDNDEWTVPVSCTNSKEILFFQGSFIPNGITSSFLNLSQTLAENSQIRQTVVLQPEAVWNHEDRFEKFEQLDDSVRAIGRVGGMAQTPEEEWLISQFNKNFEFSSQMHRDIYLHAFRREFRRMFGDAKFDRVVCFEGYARFWAALLAAAPVSQDHKLIYLHSDMEREREHRFAYLSAIFALYSHYGKLASVSPSVNDLNCTELAVERQFAKPSQFVTVQNAIDADSIREKANLIPDVELDIPADATVFVTAGRLTREKGHDLLIDAFCQIADSCEKSYLVIIGDGPLMEEYRIKVARAGLQDRILLPGYLENPLALVTKYDCYVFPSRYEGQGLALVEGLVLGLPAIGCNVVGVKSVLAHGGGKLVELSASGLAEAMAAFVKGDDWDVKAFSAEDYQATATNQFASALDL